MHKFFDNLLKYFFVFVSGVIVIGFLFFSIRNYIMPEITVTKPMIQSPLIRKDYFTGIVLSRKTVEVKADRKLYISEFDVKNSQIVEAGEKIMGLDMSRQDINVDTEVSELQNQIKAYEIEKLNLKKQLEDSQASLKKSLEAYEKAKEEYENTSFLYDNGVVTKEELDGKNDAMEQCREDYDNEVSLSLSEKEIYDANMNHIDGEIKILRAKLQGKNNEIGEEKISVDNSGAYFLPDKVYIEYITDKKVVEEGDIVLKYSVCNTNADLYMEAVMDRSVYNNIFSNKYSLYFWKDDEKKRETVVTESVRFFPDHSELIFALKDEPKENLYISDSVKFMAQSKEEYECVVDKTAVVPIGELKPDNDCYVYSVLTEESILGQVNHLKQGEYKILAVGESTVAIEPLSSNKEIIDKDSLIVNYASSVLEDDMRVRVIN